MILEARQRFFKESKNPNLKQRINERITRIPYNKLTTNQYIKFLKENTRMNFRSVLDIGCRYGTLVKSFQDMGIYAKGIESDQFFIKHKVTNNIEWKYFDENYESDVKYDMIVFGQSIYYIPGRFGIMAKAKSMLSNNGFILIATQNIESNTIKEYEEQLTVDHYEKFAGQLNLQLLKVELFKSNFTKDILLEKNKLFTMLKYMLKLKKNFVHDNEGELLFMLFRKK